MSKSTVPYLLTDIPKAFHRAWKTYASILGITMKAFCFEALQEKINRIKKESENGREHSEADKRGNS